MEKITFTSEIDEINDGEWAAAWSLCPNLQVLTASGILVEQIRAIMATPKHHLEEIKINHMCNEEDYSDSYTESIMNIITGGTNNIERLQIDCDVPYSLGDSDRFINENKSTSRSVTIWNDYPFSSSE